MKLSKHKEMIKGWFIGNFKPTLLKTSKFEVGFKNYIKGDYEKAHYHKKAIEITLIATGRVRMNGVEYFSGDIITISRGEATDFEALTDCQTVVIKIPSVRGDKYEVDSTSR